MTNGQNTSKEAQANRDVRDAVDRLKKKYPKAGLSFGYIGNFERWGDDRAYYIFSEIQRPYCVYGQGRRFSWGGYPAAHGGIYDMLETVNSLEKKIIKALKQSNSNYCGCRGCKRAEERTERLTAKAWKREARRRGEKQ